MLSATCLARRRRMHCRGSDAAGSAAAAAAGQSAGTQQGRLRRPPQDAGSAPDSGRGRRHQTVHGEHALAPGGARRQQGRRTGSAAAVALEPEATAAGDARGEAEEEEEDASAPSSEASSVVCAVCLEEVRGGRAEAEAITLPCSHAYHPGCVLPWLAVHRACPCCRATVPSPEN